MAKFSSYEAAVAAGVEHVRGNAQFERTQDSDHPARLIEEGRGSREGCFRSLNSMHRARALYAWFANYDLKTFKQESYVASKLQYIRCKDFGWEFPHEQDFFHFLASDHAPLLRLWSSFVVTPEWGDFFKEANDPKDHLFRHYQMSLALRGEWELLARRAELQLGMEHTSKHKRFLVDQRFYLALARGDKTAMEEALAELTSPRMARVRNDQFEFGLTNFFIGTHATMYAKIAWRAGYEAEVDTPFIPKEWMPMQPLEKYVDPYPFMRAYDTDAL